MNKAFRRILEVLMMNRDGEVVGKFNDAFIPLRSVYDLKLGEIVRDRISGFQGIAASRVEYITGCTQIAVARPGLVDGKPADWQYFDWQRLEVHQSRWNEFEDLIKSEATAQRNGAGDPPPPRY